MEESSLNQSSYRKAWQDTECFRHSTSSFWGVEIVGASVLGLCGGYVGFLLTPMDATPKQGFLYPGIGGVVGVIAGLLIVFGGIYLWNLFRAPYKQRNEARNLVLQMEKPSDIEISDTIVLLEKETLLLRHNDGEERSYSFAQVFLSISDQLSIGIPLNSFEEKMRSGLDIDEKGGWYFPSEHKGIIHLIGVLDQNALIERKIEEYQHMVGGINYATSVITALQPPEHLAKGTITKYYLSTFGITVIQRLKKHP